MKGFPLKRFTRYSPIKPQASNTRVVSDSSKRNEGREGEDELAFLITSNGSYDLEAFVQEKVDDVDGDETGSSSDEDLEEERERKREGKGREMSVSSVRSLSSRDGGRGKRGRTYGITLLRDGLRSGHGLGSEGVEEGK